MPYLKPRSYTQKMPSTHLRIEGIIFNELRIENYELGITNWEFEIVSHSFQCSLAT